MCKYEVSTSRLLKVIVWQTYLQTDRQTDKQTRSKLLHTPLRGWYYNISIPTTSETVMVTDYRGHRRTVLSVWEFNLKARTSNRHNLFSTSGKWELNLKLAGNICTPCWAIAPLLCYSILFCVVSQADERSDQRSEVKIMSPGWQSTVALIGVVSTAADFIVRDVMRLRSVLLAHAVFRPAVDQSIHWSIDRSIRIDWRQGYLDILSCTQFNSVADTSISEWVVSYRHNRHVFRPLPYTYTEVGDDEIVNKSDKRVNK